MKKIFTCMTALLLVLLLSCSALAEATGNNSVVTYADRTELFIFEPGSEYEATDLFDSFKGLLPGDTAYEQITVQNSSSKKVRIFLQCKYDSYVTTDAKDFLHQLNLTVDMSGDTNIFDAPADLKAQLSAPVLLGTFKKNGKVDLTVKLEVPAEMGNEYMGQIGVVPWTFIIEEVPEDDTPDTGDDFQMEIWLGAAAVLAALIFVLLVWRRKRETAEE